MYTLYKFQFLNGISEINQLFDDILIIWPAPVVIIYYFLLFYCGFPLFLIIWNEDKKTKKKHANKFKHPFNIYYFLNITDELIKK